MIVTSNRVNMRATPSTGSEVVGQVNEGDELKVLSRREEWLEIVPPEGVSFWVHEAFVRNGVVKVGRLNVRAGSGINYSTVGYLTTGDTIRQQGSFGEWLKIAPPEGTSLWIHRDLTRPKQQAQARNPVEQETRVPARETAQPVEDRRTTAPTGSDNLEAREEVPPVRPPDRRVSLEQIQVSPMRTPVRARDADDPVIARDPPPAPADLQLVPLQGQGRISEYEGVLRTVNILSSAPAGYRLVVPRGRGFETVCYVRGNRAQLSSFRGKQMKIVGPEYWVQGHSLPVIVPDKIIPTTRP